MRHYSQNLTTNATHALSVPLPVRPGRIRRAVYFGIGINYQTNTAATPVVFDLVMKFMRNGAQVGDHWLLRGQLATGDFTSGAVTSGFYSFASPQDGTFCPLPAFGVTDGVDLLPSDSIVVPFKTQAGSSLTPFAVPQQLHADIDAILLNGWVTVPNLSSYECMIYFGERSLEF